MPTIAQATKKRRESQYYIPQTFEQWKQIADTYGLKEEEPWYKKLAKGTWKGVKTVFDVLQRPNYAIAGASKAIVRGDENPLSEAWKGLTGREKETFSDVLGEVGIENKYARAIGGFALDVVLDPTTYLGGAGLLKRVGAGGANLTKAGRSVLEEIATKKATAIDGLRSLPNNEFLKASSLIEEQAALKLEQALLKNPNKYFKGITFAGKEIVSRKVALGRINTGVDELGKVTTAPALSKIVPNKVYRKFEVIGKTLDEALQNAFNPKKGTSDIISGRVYGAKNLMQKIYTAQTEQTEKLWNKATPQMQDEFVEGALGVKDEYWNIFKGKEKQSIDELKALGITIPENYDIKKLDKVIFNFEDKVKGKIETIENSIRKIKGFDETLGTKSSKIDELNATLEDVNKELSKLFKQYNVTTSKGKVVKVAQEVTEEEYDNTIQRVLELKFGDLYEKINNKIDLIRKIKADIKAGKITKKTKGAAKKIEKPTSDDYIENIKFLFDDIDELQGQVTSVQGSVNKLILARQNALKEANKLNIADVYKQRTGKDMSLESKEFIEKEVVPFLEGYAQRHGYEGKGLKYYFPTINQEKLVELAKKSLPSGMGEKEIARWMNKTEYKDILKKPFEAYTLKESLLIKNEVTRQTLKDLVEISGYRSGGDINGKIIRNLSDIPEEIRENFTEIKLTGDKSPIGFIPKEYKEFINSALFPEMKTIDMLARATGYDAFTNVFKEFVTAWFPAFHVRNAASGVVQNYEVLGAEVFNPKNIINGFRIMRGKGDDIIEYAGRQFTAKELQDALTNRFFGASRYISDFSQYADDMINIKKTSKFSPRKIGNFVETNQKAHAFSTALDKGMPIDEALRMAEKAGFDYNVMTSFEQSVMKRIIPFYAFARKNAGLQATTLIEKPARIINQKKALDMLSEMLGGDKLTEEDLAGLPPWVRETIGIKVKDGQVLSNLDFPIQEFAERVANPMKTTITSMNPLIKMPFEVSAGYDFFRGKPIKDISGIDKPMFDVLNSENTPDFIKNLFRPQGFEFETKAGKDEGTKQMGYKANPDALYVLRNIPTSRLQNTLVSLFDNDRTTADKAFAFIMGGRIYDIDQGMQEYYDQKDIISKWQEELELIGEGYGWEKFQVKKDPFTE